MFVITRREFIKMSMASAAALGFSPLIRWPTLAQADDPHTDPKPAVVWLEGQDCAGCTESVITYEGIKGAILDAVAIRYHETIMAGAGTVAEVEALDAAIAQGGYILVVEGSMPGLEPEFLEVAGHPLEEKFYEAAKAAGAIAAIGACGAFGGIPRAGSTTAGQDTQGQGVGFFIDRWNTENPTDPIAAPLVNIPGCPVHPIWFWDTAVAVIDTLVNGAPLPALDEFNRPTLHFGCTIHETCPRERYYRQNRFLEDWNSSAQRKYCLLKKGCKGPVTYADCNVIKWNQGVNCCVQNNAPCSGCTEPLFYHELGSVYGPCEKS
jgi:hydrogenase small subunit